MTARLAVVELYFHHVPGGFDRVALERFAAGVVGPCLGQRGKHDAPLGALETVEVSLVSDEVIGGVHGEFMGDPGATDVITFQHGEAFISTDTALRCAAELGHAVEREVGLYLTHALLHLNGYEDAEAEEREEMRAVQERILDEVWGEG